MTTTEILSRCRRLKVTLTRVGDKLEINAPRGVIDADLRNDLATHREEILAALAPPDRLEDPIFLKLTDWLYKVIDTCNGECFTDEHGRRWDVLGTAAELVLAPWSTEWIDEVQAFSKAMSQHRNQKGV
jgi:hypothetical protein